MSGSSGRSVLVTWSSSPPGRLNLALDALSFVCREHPEEGKARPEVLPRRVDEARRPIDEQESEVWEFASREGSSRRARRTRRSIGAFWSIATPTAHRRGVGLDALASLGKMMPSTCCRPWPFAGGEPGCLPYAILNNFLRPPTTCFAASSPVQQLPSLFQLQPFTQWAILPCYRLHLTRIQPKKLKQSQLY